MTSSASQGRLAFWIPAVLAGLATIGAYGVVLYAVGVLVVPIGRESGWGTGTPVAAVSLGVLLSGPAALVAGSQLDRRGSRPVLFGALVTGAPLLALASWATQPLAFVVAWSLGAALTAGGLYYAITMAVTSRLYEPTRRTHAFGVLTFLGALASPVFYPLAGFLVEALGWRGAIRALVGVMVVLVAPAALTLRAPPAAVGSGPEGDSVWSAVRAPAVWRLLLAFGLAAAATNALLLHQVGVLEAAGFSLAVASTIAGARGFFQIPGRVVLVPLTRYLGLRGGLGTSYVLCAAAVACLLIAPGSIEFATLYAVGAGISIGLLSPLQGLLAPEAYGAQRLGVLSGVQQLVVAGAGALGAWVSGQLVSLGGGYNAALLAIMVALALAAAGLRWSTHAVSDQGTPTPHPLEERPHIEV